MESGCADTSAKLPMENQPDCDSRSSMTPIQKYYLFAALKNPWPVPGKCIMIILFLLLILIPYYFSLPSTLFQDPCSVIILDRNDQLAGASISEDEQWRFPAPESLPEKYIQAVMLYEDKRFFHHPGVDLLAMARALRQNMQAGDIVSGGSTITMQVIRLARKGRPRTLREKWFEMLLASRLELACSKEEILLLYAAHAPFGGNVVGLEAAAWRYFGRNPDQLSWAEVAMLAVLPNSPSLIHPGKNRDLLKKKRDKLLGQLTEKCMIDSMTCHLAQNEPLPPKPFPLPRYAPHLMQRMKRKIGHLPAEKRADASRVHSTIELNLQKRCGDILLKHHAHLAENQIHNLCALIVEVKSGEVISYIGNIEDTSEGHGNWVDIIKAPRSTGSILKPLLYGAMMQSGDLLPETLVPDIPTRLGGFAPQNFDRTYQGAVPASMALARSLNVPSVRMLQDYGIDRFYHFLKQCGMGTLFRPARGYGLSLILGGAEGTLWEITGIYASMARTLLYNFDDSLRQDPPFFMPVCTIPDKIEQRHDPPVSAGACWLTFQAMQAVARPGDEAVWREFVSSRRVAWKTGTSYGFRDAWAVGVTPEYAVGVWVGNADGQGRPHLTGFRAAAPVLFDLFNILPPTSWFQCPEPDLMEIEVCAESGYRKGPHCRETKIIHAIPAGRRTAPCPYCRPVHLDSTGKWRVDSRIVRIRDIRTEQRFVLPPVMEWYYKRHHTDYHPLPPFKQSDPWTEESSVQSMSLIYPDYGGVIYIPVELSGRRGRTVFEAAHRHPHMKIYWHLDATYLGETQDIHQIELKPKPGEHILTLIDEQGQMIQRKFTVLIE